MWHDIKIKKKSRADFTGSTVYTVHRQQTIETFSLSTALHNIGGKFFMTTKCYWRPLREAWWRWQQRDLALWHRREKAERTARMENTM